VAPGTHLSFSPKIAIEAVDLSQAPVDGPLLGLPGPYHRHVIVTFNICSRVPTPRSLTDTGRGYRIENLRIAIALLPPFPSEGSTDPLMASPGLRLSVEGTRPKSHECEPPLDFYHNIPSKHDITNNKPSQDEGNKDKIEGRSQCIYGVIQLL
jgi:hypothetical protein